MATKMDFYFSLKMGHFAEKNNTRPKKKLISECKANIFYIFLNFSKTQKMHLLSFAKVGQYSHGYHMNVVVQLGKYIVISIK